MIHAHAEAVKNTRSVASEKVYMIKKWERSSRTNREAALPFCVYKSVDFDLCMTSTGEEDLRKGKPYSLPSEKPIQEII